VFRKSLKVPFGYFILFTVCMLLTACNQGRMLIASFRSTDNFIPLAADKRIFCEPGAADYGNEIARVLPEALRKVEQAHYLQSKDTVAV
jgi:hypothetical protein